MAQSDVDGFDIVFTATDVANAQKIDKAIGSMAKNLENASGQMQTFKNNLESLANVNADDLKKKLEDIQGALSGIGKIKPSGMFETAVSEADELLQKIISIADQLSSMPSMKLDVSASDTEVVETKKRKKRSKKVASDIAEDTTILTKYELLRLEDINHKLATTIDLLTKKKGLQSGIVQATGMEDMFVVNEIKQLETLIRAFTKAKNDLLVAKHGVAPSQALAETPKDSELQERTTRSTADNVERENVARQKNIAYLTQMIALIDSILKKGAGVDIFSGMQQHLVDLQGQMKSLLSDQRTTTEKHVEQQKKNAREMALAYFKMVAEEIGAQEKLKQETIKKQEETRKAIEKIHQDRQKMYDKIFGASTFTADSAMAYSKNARSLNELTHATKMLKDAMKNLDPNMGKWKALNEQYKATNERIKNIKREMGDLNDRIRGLLPTVKNLAMQIGVAFSVQQLLQWIRHMVDVRAQFELQNIALRSILQNKQEANRLFAEIQQMALQSPFSIMQLNTYVKQLAAYRVETEKLADTTKRLADVSAGLGVDMSRLILAYGQVKTANYLRATEVRQFTEAGLNIAGELAKYFSELRGTMISAGDVMEMITKRMVRFEDVEEVFKRITNEGGIFYDMQKKQAEGLAGQIQRLQDAYNIALNNIGKNNIFIISTVLSTFRTLIQHYSLVTTAIGGVITLYGMLTIKSLILGEAMTKLAVGVKAVSAALATGAKSAWMNPYTAMAAVLAVTAVHLYDTARQINETNKAYDDIAKSTFDAEMAFARLKDKVEDNNKVIKENNEILKTAQNGSHEYAEALNNIKNASNANATAQQELKNAFGDAAYAATTLKDGILDLKDAESHFSDIQQGVRFLSAKMKQSFLEGVFTDDMATNLNDYSENVTELNAKLEEGAVIVNNLVALSLQELENSRANGEITQEELDAYNKISQKWVSISKELKKAKDENKNILEYAEQARDSYSELLKLMYNIGHSDFGVHALRYEIAYIYGAVNELRENADKINVSFDTSQAEKELDKMFGYIAQKMLVPVEKLKNLEEPQRKIAAELGREFLKQTNAALDQFQLDLLDRKFQLTVGVAFREEKPQSERGYLERLIASYTDVLQGRLGVSKAMFNNEVVADYFKRLKDEYKDTETQIGKLERAQVALNELQSNKEAIEQLKKENEFRKEMLKHFGEWEEKEKKGADKTEQTMRNRIQLLKDANAMYEKLRKEMSETNAAQETYNNLIERANSLSMGKFFEKGKKYTSESIVGDLEQLSKMFGYDTSSFKKKYANAYNEMLKSIGEMKFEASVELNKESRDNITRQLNEMLSGYELSIELEKGGMPPEMAKSLFGLDRKSLTDIQQEWGNMWLAMVNDAMKKTKEFTPYTNVENALQSLGDAHNEFVKQYMDGEEQITKKIHKEFESRVKEYMNFLKKSYSNAAQIQVETLNKVQSLSRASEMEKSAILQDKTISENEKKRRIEEVNKMAEQIAQGFKENMQKQLDEEQWKSFKASPIFENLFADMDALGTKTIDALIKKIEDLKGTLGTLKPSIIKEMVQAQEKLFQAKADRKPFTEYINALKEVNKLRSEGLSLEKISKQLAEKSIELEESNAFISDLEVAIDFKQKGLSLDKEGLTLSKQQQKYVQDDLGTLRNTLNFERQHNKELTTTVTKLNEQQGSYRKLSVAQKTLINKWQAAQQVMAQTFGAIKDGLTAFGADADTKAVIEPYLDGLESIGNSVIQLGILFVALGQKVNSALGIIGIVATAVSAIFSVFSMFAKAHDAALENQIKAQQKKLKELQNAYDDLGKAIENAFTGKDLSYQTQKSIENLDQQVQSYEQMIKAEEEKKDSDDSKIQEWNDAIRDAKNKMFELQEEYIKELGGLATGDDIKDAANNFVDAWADAFGETRDGLGALTNSFNDFFRNIVKKQMAMAISDPWISKLQQMVKDSFYESGDVNYEQLRNTMAWAQEVAIPAMDESLTNFAELFESIGGSWSDMDSKLSGLAAGIQGITEETAQILEALLNSMRYYVVDTNEQMQVVVNTLTNPPSDNLFLVELRAQTEQLRILNKSLSSVIRGGHPKGGSGLKVFQD